MSSPTGSGGPSTNPFLSSPTAAATAGNTTQPIVDLFGSLPATAETSQVIIHNYRPNLNITHTHTLEMGSYIIYVYLVARFNRLDSLIRKFLHSKDCY